MDTYLDKLRMETEIFMFDSNVQKKLKAVSYTHLDVYKRQLSVLSPFQVPGIGSAHLPEDL